MNPARYFFLFVTLLVLSLGTNAVLDNWHYKDGDHKRLQKTIDKKLHRLDREYRRLTASSWKLNAPASISPGHIWMAFKKDQLVYWSDNSISHAGFNAAIPDGQRFLFLSNAWFIVKPYINDSMRVYGLVCIKTEYPYDNDFLPNRFLPDLGLPRTTELLTEPQPGSFAIHDWEGIYLFSVRFSNNELRYMRVESYLVPFLWILCFFSLLLLLNSIIRQVKRPRGKAVILGATIVLLFILRILQYKFHLPDDLYALDAFGPVPFARSLFLPSLGDVFANSLLFLFIIYLFSRDFHPSEIWLKRPGRKHLIPVLLLMFVLTACYLYTHYILSNLILHSTISFEAYRLASLNVYSILGLLIAAMHFAALLLIANKLLAYCTYSYPFGKVFYLFVLINAGAFLVMYLADYRLDGVSYLALIAMFALLMAMHYRGISVAVYTPLSALVIAFSVYLVFFISYYSNRKNNNNMRVMAENLAAQHDPVAEYLLVDISKLLSNDETLKRFLFNLDVPSEQIFNYLRSNYFNGFWGKYTLQFIDCWPETKIILEEAPIPEEMNCHVFYNQLIETGSMQLPGTWFYFLDSPNGRINYLGTLRFMNPVNQKEVSFYLELKSRLTSEEPGFPELLLDEKFRQNKLLEEFSYAKYFDNKLVTQSGSFPYSLELATYREKPSRFDGYDHFIYYLNADHVVIVSKPTTSLFDNLVSFSYIFLFFYFILIIILLSRNISRLGTEIELNFKNKIQFSVIAVLLVSLLLVGGGTIFFSIQQYQRKQHEILGEKIQSVYLELDHVLAYLKYLRSNWHNEEYAGLHQLLRRFSDVFYSDINLYAPNGTLLATSRPEIFSQGLLGERMNPTAFSMMAGEKQAEFIHREHIGRLSYLSAYVPFVNAENDLLAYLNLPYFTRQNILRNDVTTLVVAVVNIYVLLMLITLALTVIISDQITRPLRMIQQKFSEIKLGKKNEIIVYRGKDEIAGLVDEYNRMVKELVNSMEKLARSERETAWREMAKQIAHEIKNPLTPMKLSVQHLQRSWNDNRADFDAHLEKVSRTLIEQIDNLSFIASEFSNFAKMPRANNEPVNAIEIIGSALALFDNTENVSFVFGHEQESIFVFADREQLSRVFINLIKNAIQAIPENRPGRVGIDVVLAGDRVRIGISDNGKGIEEEVQSKLFTPSFTTKTSGMGLGLSITKNIIESFGGHITFKTKINHGTTFIIELPVYYTGI